MAANAEDVQQKEGENGEHIREHVAAIVGRLEKEAEDRVTKRDLVEKRWLEDLQQYHGKYDETLVKKFEDAKKSTLYMNATRPKTNAMASRLSDMLFPTDDRNWGIGPTPVPELTVEAEETARAAAEAQLAVAENPDDPQRQEAANVADQKMVEIQARMKEARRRARSMEEEIDDQLREAKYAPQAREVIEDGCKLGTGVMKGPVAGERARRAWQLDQEKQEFALTDVEDKRPVYWRVDPWNFFPDMDAKSMEDCEGVYERHLMNKKQLRRLARQPGMDQDAIRRLLTDQPRGTVPHYLTELRSITGAYHDVMSDRYTVWEYHGPLTLDDMQNLATLLRKDGIRQDLEELEVDPLDELEAVVWFCQGELLKFGLHHLDSDEVIYSVFNLEKDEASVFGFGVPSIMRDPQTAKASAWRTLMDNAGLAAGPQIVINEEVIEPYDGQWVIEPRKLWRRKTGAPKDMKPFEIHEISSHLEELSAIIELADNAIDEETSMPVIAQGEQGAHVTKTAHGMSILMNSVNVIFRRIVKNWDDDMTTPNIRRIYDWNMQFSTKQHIKGDFQVDARGTSVLLVREMQSANLLSFLMNFAGHPTLGKFIKEEGLRGLRRLAQTMMIPADELVKSDEEVRQDEAKAAKQPVVDPEMEKIAAQLNLEKMRGESALQLEEMRRETALIEMAGKMNMKIDELRAKLEGAREERQSKERMMATEAALTARQGPSGGGHF